MQTGTSTPAARRRRTTLTPSRSGIITWRTTTAGGRCATSSRAARPPDAVDTAKPSRRSARSRACRTLTSSSTTRTRGRESRPAASRRAASPIGRSYPWRRPPRKGRFEGILHLLRVDVQPLRERGGERVALVGADLVERRLELVGRHAERGGEPLAD